MRSPGRAAPAWLAAGCGGAALGLLAWAVGTAGLPTSALGAAALVGLGVAAGAWWARGLLRELADRTAGEAARTRELEARRRELAEARDQQAATEEILRAVRDSRADVGPVLDTIARRAAQVCHGLFTVVYRFDGALIHLAAWHDFTPAGLEALRRQFPTPPGDASVAGRAIRDGRVIHVTDMARDPDVPPAARETARAQGYRSLVVVPLADEGRVLGAISVGRADGPFTDRQIALLGTFAAHGVITLENARLFQTLETRNRELTETLEQQTATSEILRAISGSPTDIQPTFDVIVRSAAGLCRAAFGAIYRVEAGLVHLAGAHNIPEAVLERFRRTFPDRPHRGLLAMRAILDGAVAHVPDLAADPEFRNREMTDPTGVRSMVAVPLLRDGQPVGAIAVGRATTGPFDERLIGLLRTFADQAVIAIENVRLFRELEARNRDLAEALEQQTATAEILGIIARSTTDVGRVFQAIVEKAVSLTGGLFGTVILAEDGALRLGAAQGFSGDALERLQRSYPMPADRALPSAHVIRTGEAVHVPDAQDSWFGEWARSLGFRSFLGVPMFRGGRVIGAIAVARREAGLYSDRTVALLRTFADQAVIAIENARLFTELETRNRALAEGLERQTATSEILRVISSSPTDVQPVFDTIVRNAARLSDAAFSALMRLDGGMLSLDAVHGMTEAELDTVRPAWPRPLGRDSAGGRAILGRQVVHIEDAGRDAEYSVVQAPALGFGTVMAVPLLRRGAAIGAISQWRREVRPFTDAEIQLVQTFADQAVIAIENVRLFRELEARSQELARSVEELRALGEVGRAVSSSLDLETVLRTIVSRANQLAGTDGGAIYELDEDAGAFRLRVTEGLDAELVEALRDQPIRLGEGAVGRAGTARAPVQIPDVLVEGAYTGRLRALIARAGFRGILAVPLLREESLMGALVVRRRQPGTFPPETVALLQTFATQSVLAIQHARLFRELEQKSRELETASRHKSQFLANMSHELRTPLNAVLGYTELLVDGIYGELPEPVRDVMSRIDRSGRHLLGLINDVLDLSKIEAGQLTLALADYSLREVVHAVVAQVEALAAEKGLALRAAVPADLPAGRGDERRLTQVLLNLVGNAIKFTEAGEVRIEATLREGAFVVAVTDTGPGIAPADQARIFEEFQQVDSSSTRRKGGTGLGLSIARRIVELHGGRLGVESAVGRGSTFTFTVPGRVERPASRA
jgi:GAF domain-containing protein/anti-sigma regulatory factor (Ser/Thr protein kinase)